MCLTTDKARLALKAYGTRRSSSTGSAFKLSRDRMAKRKRKLTAAEKRTRKKRREEFMIIFINGKQKRVPREPMIEGMPVDEFIRRNADPLWRYQNEMWELIGDD